MEILKIKFVIVNFINSVNYVHLVTFSVLINHTQQTIRLFVCTYICEY